MLESHEIDRDDEGPLFDFELQLDPTGIQLRDVRLDVLEMAGRIQAVYGSLDQPGIDRFADAQARFREDEVEFLAYVAFGCNLTEDERRWRGLRLQCLVCTWRYKERKGRRQRGGPGFPALQIPGAE